METKTVKGTLHKNTITTSIETIPVITYKGTPDCTGWFLLQETQFRYDTKWVVVEYVEEEN